MQRIQENLDHVLWFPDGRYALYLYNVMDETEEWKIAERRGVEKSDTSNKLVWVESRCLKKHSDRNKPIEFGMDESMSLAYMARRIVKTLANIEEWPRALGSLKSDLFGDASRSPSIAASSNAPGSPEVINWATSPFRGDLFSPKQRVLTTPPPPKRTTDTIVPQAPLTDPIAKADDLGE